MKEIRIDVESLKKIILRLEDAIYVCYTAPDDDQKGYPFATGYSKSCMQETVLCLKDYIDGG